MASLLDNILENIGGIGAAPDVAADMDFAQGAAQAQGLFGGLEPLQEEPVVAPNWQKQAQAPLGGLASRQKENEELINSHRQGGSTSRYYTRQLYREMLKSKDPEARIQARLGLRFNGAPGNAGSGLQSGGLSGAGGKTSEADWRATFPGADERRTSEDGLPPVRTGGDWSTTFKDTRANDFGAAAKGQKFNPKSGQLESLPQKSIAQSTKETQDILDGIARMTGSVTQRPSFQVP